MCLRDVDSHVREKFISHKIKKIGGRYSLKYSNDKNDTVNTEIRYHNNMFGNFFLTQHH